MCLLIRIFCLIVLINACKGAFKIPEPDSYEPKVTPSNVNSARSILGYDNIKILPKYPDGKENRRSYPWEMESDEVKHNFGMKF
ncbi:unnamed protein product [Phyllotreta striolata]|uniref:Uncharacterized protein n=1 Tax=Phyllotreta striolata TaxID=444603 RepID=A0A9N9TSE1_PHYSR|nr:unnamed protein product [Phyllotreta striolata]